jgi:hypothetical protein
MDKPEYIQNLESKEDILSVIFCPELKGDFLKFLGDKKLRRVYETSSIDSQGLIKFDEVILKSQQGFYLCVKNKTQINYEPKFNLTIYYKIEQYNELVLFSSQLLKQYKNATTDIRGNQTKN